MTNLLSTLGFNKRKGDEEKPERDFRCFLVHELIKTQLMFISVQDAAHL